MGGLGLMGCLGVAVVAFFLWAKSSQLAEADYTEILTYASPEAAANPVDPTLTVVSYNIGYLSGLTNNRAVDRTEALFDQNQATAIAALEAIQPDIIGFQEIDFNSRRSYYHNQLDAIAAALAMPMGTLAVNWDKRYVPFPYWPPTAHFAQILSGQALLSRYPIQTNQRIVLEKVPSNPFYYNALYLDRVAQVSTLDVGGRPLVVINIHLEAFDAPTRYRQTEAVRQLAETYAQQGPTVLMGDFNSDLNRAEEGESHSIQVMLDSPVLAPTLAPSELQNNREPTFPSDQPEYRLDYIFYTPDTLELVEGRVLTDAAQASDHLPISATFKLRE